jgi:hypothetical protein
MKKKEQYQKRALTLQKLHEICELYPQMPLAEIMSILMSPIGEEVHPFKWDDNTLLGKLEKLEKELAKDYKMDYLNEYTDGEDDLT